MRRDGSEQDLWSATAAAGWGATPEVGQFMLGVARVHADRTDTRLFLAEHDGRAIAPGALSVSDGVAVLAGASTIPEGRGRGAQLALLARRLSYAAEQRCDLPERRGHARVPRLQRQSLATMARRCVPRLVARRGPARRTPWGHRAAVRDAAARDDGVRVRAGFEGTLRRYVEFPNLKPGDPQDVLCYATNL